MNKKELDEVVAKHGKYTRNEEGGEKADLREANLYGADLSRAYLSRAKGVYSFGPMGQEGRIGYALWTADGVMFALGCHWGNLKETRAAIVAKYGKKSLYEAQVVLAEKVLMANVKPDDEGASS